MLNAFIEFIDRFYDLPGGVDTHERKKGYQGRAEQGYAREEGIDRRVDFLRALPCKNIPPFAVEPAVFRYDGRAYRRKTYDGTVSAMGIVPDHAPPGPGLRDRCNEIGTHLVTAEGKDGAHNDRSRRIDEVCMTGLFDPHTIDDRKEFIHAVPDHKQTDGCAAVHDGHRDIYQVHICLPFKL